MLVVRRDYEDGDEDGAAGDAEAIFCPLDR